MPPGSCSSAHVTVPPVGTFFGFALLYLVAAAAGPASEPATRAAAPTFPAFSSSSRRLTVRSNTLSVGFWDITPPVSGFTRGQRRAVMRDKLCTWPCSTSQGNSCSEDLPHARSLASDVVVERGLAELQRGERRDRHRVEG